MFNRRTNVALAGNSQINLMNTTNVTNMENENLNGWIPIADKLPYPLETVWLTNGHNFVTLGCRVIENDEYYWATTNGIIYVENNSIVSECEYDDVDDIIYWQPLPELPKI